LEWFEKEKIWVHMERRLAWVKRGAIKKKGTNKQGRCTDMKAGMYGKKGVHRWRRKRLKVLLRNLEW
jgi:hypothetical protein